MKPKLKNRILAFALGLVVMVVAMGLFSGCGDQPLAPTGASDDPVVVNNTGKGTDGTAINGGSVDPAGVIRDVVRGLLIAVERSTSKIVGVLGGTLGVTLPSGEARFTIPPNALVRLVRIDMDVTQLKSQGRFFTCFDFGPDGLVFNQPSLLTLSLPYPEGTSVSLYWLNPATGQWEVQEVKTVRAGKVQFLIHHFSKYGIN